MTEVRAKWDAIYSKGAEAPAPLDALLRFSSLLPTEGRALDVACGRAANAMVLARRGLEVSAWDISPVVIEWVANTFAEEGLRVDAQARDIAAEPPDANSFDVIVVANYLDRTLAPHLCAALRPGGWLIYQTFVVDKVDDVGPSNPEYLLATGELLSLFDGLITRAYMDFGSSGDGATGLRNAALLIAQKPHGGN